MDELTAFLTARLDEDEAAAVAAAGDGTFGGRPHWSAAGTIVTDAGDPDWAVVDLSPCIEDAALGVHIARHDPARALREVEFGRPVLVAYETRVRAFGEGCPSATAASSSTPRPSTAITRITGRSGRRMPAHCPHGTVITRPWRVVAGRERGLA